MTDSTVEILSKAIVMLCIINICSINMSQTRYLTFLGTDTTVCSKEGDFRLNYLIGLAVGAKQSLVKKSVSSM